MPEGWDRGEAAAMAGIGSSNIGFQVRPSVPSSPAHSFFTWLLLGFDSVCVLGLLQLLKKSGWKEGTGLGAQEQVCFSILASSMSRVRLSISSTKKESILGVIVLVIAWDLRMRLNSV